MTVDILVRKISEDFAVERSVEITADTELLMSGLLDSLAVVNLVAWIETEIGKPISPTEIVIENFETVQAMTNLLERLDAKLVH